MSTIVWIVVGLLFVGSECGSLYKSDVNTSPGLTPVKRIFGNPLILTGLINRGDHLKAQKLAKVEGAPFPKHIRSYSGYLTVNKKYDSNLFFWFFPAQTNYKTAPVLLWLQGGPGASSMFGLFTEIGPFSVANDSRTLVENPYSWTLNHSVIFIDNPVGTGFSYTTSERGLATSQKQISHELYIALIQFFKLFPELRTNDFFLTGESYAGKHIPGLGYTIHHNNKKADFKINLKGLAVGNGFTDPYSVLDNSNFAFELGLIDTRMKKDIYKLENKAKKLVEKRMFKAAFKPMDEGHGKLSTVGIFNVYDIRKQRPDDVLSMISFLRTPNILKLLHTHTGYIFKKLSQTVYNKLIPNFMSSMRVPLQFLMNHYRVLYYSGQFDLVVPYSSSVRMYERLNWSGKSKYQQAPRRLWHVGSDLAGYARSGGNFTEVLVRNAGHMVPTDQPAWALDLITKFTFNKMDEIQ